MHPQAASLIFELQPLLQGKHVRLRPLLTDDWDELYACAADPLIWEQHPQSNRHEKEIFRKFFAGALESGGALVVLDVNDGKIIGTSRYYNFTEEPARVIVGYTFLTRKYWGGEVNREMKHLMLTHAFCFVDEVRFEIGINNFRSRRAIEKLGARLLRKEDLDQNPHVVYGIHRADYSKRCSLI